MQAPISVTCALIQNRGKILVTQRNHHMSQPLKWEFPGGKIEHCEGEVACIIREIKEELNIDIQPFCRLTPSVTDEIKLIPFRCHFIGGEITLSEHANYRWIPPQTLLSLDWSAADLPIVKEFLQKTETLPA